jgi:hypothetical protein
VRLLKAFMFEALDPKELEIVIDAMDICDIKPGEVVIR